MYQGSDVRPDDWRLIDFKPTHCRTLTVSRSAEAYEQEERSIHSEQSTLNHSQDGKNNVLCRELVADDDYRQWLHEVIFSLVYTLAQWFEFCS